MDYIVNLFLIFWRISILFSLIDAPIYISTDRAQGFLFSVSFPTHFLFCVFDNIHPNICEVISHCGFDLHFTDYWWCWVPFQVTVGHLYVFIEKKKSTYLLCPFFNWVFRSFFFAVQLSCMSSLYILDINLLSDICKYPLLFNRISFHFVGGFLCSANEQTRQKETPWIQRTKMFARGGRWWEDGQNRWRGLRGTNFQL